MYNIVAIISQIFTVENIYSTCNVHLTSLCSFFIMGKKLRVQAQKKLLMKLNKMQIHQAYACVNCCVYNQNRQYLYWL